MSSRLRAVWLLTLLAVAAAAGEGHAQHRALPRSALAVETANGWKTWWRSREAPGEWRAAHVAVTAAVRWQQVRPGLESGELRLAGRGEAWRIRVVLVRLDPQHFDFRLREVTRGGGALPGWSTDSAAADAALAFNAGHFTSGTPWGWLVRDGREVQPPGVGPLSMSVVVDRVGRVQLVPADSIPAVRAAGGIREAFQSYPMLLFRNGSIPAQLQGEGRGVDLRHRDSRLAIGELRDGRLLIALTRFEGLGGVLSELPFGLTTPETAALMGALGCDVARRRALRPARAPWVERAAAPLGGAAPRPARARAVRADRRRSEHGVALITAVRNYVEVCAHPTRHACVGVG